MPGRNQPQGLWEVVDKLQKTLNELLIFLCFCLGAQCLSTHLATGAITLNPSKVAMFAIVTKDKMSPNGASASLLVAFWLASNKKLYY